MKSKRKIILLITIIVIIVILGTAILSSTSRATNLEKAEGIAIVPTMNDKLKADSSWCGTFQLVWNDMKKEVAKKDIVLNPQLEMVENLNKGDFDETMLSEDYYVKVYGLKTKKLKEQIENEVKKKFNQKSDILNKFDWSDKGLDKSNDRTKRYFFYSMLYREFEFLQTFDKLDNDKFGNYKDVKYFGIDKKTKDAVGDQIVVLFYNSKDDFAVIVNTKSNDEVIFYKSPKGYNFNEIYENMNKEAKEYKGSKKFKGVDEFKAPTLKFDEKREYTELTNQRFATADPKYKEAEILQAIQTIQFTLDEKGGKVKSEAAFDVGSCATSVSRPKKDEPRYFYVDDTFTVFLREKGKDKPYFAGRVDDITKFQ